MQLVYFFDVGLPYLRVQSCRAFIKRLLKFPVSFFRNLERALACPGNFLFTLYYLRRRWKGKNDFVPVSVQYAESATFACIRMCVYIKHVSKIKRGKRERERETHITRGDRDGEKKCPAEKNGCTESGRRGFLYKRLYNVGGQNHLEDPSVRRCSVLRLLSFSAIDPPAREERASALEAISNVIRAAVCTLYIHTRTRARVWVTRHMCISTKRTNVEARDHVTKGNINK